VGKSLDIPVNWYAVCSTDGEWPSAGSTKLGSPVCNLYSMHTAQAMPRQTFNIDLNSAGNTPPIISSWAKSAPLLPLERTLRPLTRSRAADARH